MMTKLKRPDSVSGTTYTLRWNTGVVDELYYITINNIEYKGKLCPFEMFITSQNVFHYPWTVALARMVSAIFRRGENVAFVAEELKQVFDPRGGQTVGDTKHHSLPAYIGKVIELHLVSIGYLEGLVVDESKIDVEAIVVKPGSITLRKEGDPLPIPPPTPEVKLTDYHRAVGASVAAKEKSGQYRQYKDSLEDFDVRF